ncbi:MAG: hypothetical protein AAF085_14845, partial [Planctomycetota bacterium]
MVPGIALEHTEGLGDIDQRGQEALWDQSGGVTRVELRLGVDVWVLGLEDLDGVLAAEPTSVSFSTMEKAASLVISGAA